MGVLLKLGDRNEAFPGRKANSVGRCKGDRACCFGERRVSEHELVGEVCDALPLHHDDPHSLLGRPPVRDANSSRRNDTTRPVSVATTDIQ